MERFDENKLKEIRNYDFLQKIDELYLPEGRGYHLRYGQRTENVPFLEIIIPTYKRPELLRETLYSILAQKGFDDYQILIMDNEGVIETPEVTPTERMIQELGSAKIVYYREDENTGFNWNHLIREARAEWLCMVHDDDLLAPGHLRAMYHVVRSHPEIQYLGCKLQPFKTGEIPPTPNALDFQIEYVCTTDFCWGFAVPLLGGWFKRENAVDLGGFPTVIHSGLGDYDFVAKMSYYYNTYLVQTALYYYRIGAQQLTANTDGEFNCRVSDYYLTRVIAEKTHHILAPMYKHEIKKLMLNKVKKWEDCTTYGSRGACLDDWMRACELKPREKRMLYSRDWFSILYWGLHRRIWSVIHPTIQISIEDQCDG